jgi:hypothetical protein
MRPDNDQPVTAPLGWGKRDPVHEELVRRRSEELIEGVLEATKGMPKIDIHLALGAACPLTTRADKAIWIAEIHRQYGDRW